MELYDEDDLKKEKKGKKIIVSLLVISIILLIILGIILVTLPRQTQQQRKSINLDGKEVIISEDLFYTGNDGQAYVSISDFAKLIGYEYYRGEYNDKYTEDSSKCYVQSESEATSFILGSNSIYKTEPDNELKYEYYTLLKPVILVNNKLYATTDAINVAFNCLARQSSTSGQINNIFTLPYLYKFYEENFKKSYGYTLSSTVKDEDGKEVKTDQSFNNQKTLAYEMAIVNRNNHFGVISTSGEVIIGNKYDGIEYVEGRQEFIVLSGKKYGVLSYTGETVINLEYDSIALLDGRDNYYLVEQNDKYGIIKSGEEIVVPIEFDKISYNIVNNKKMYYLQSGESIMTLEDYLEQL